MNASIRSQRLRETIGLYSTVFAIFAYVFGPWQGNSSAAWLVWDLIKFLRSDNQLIDTSRQTTILMMLGAIIGCLVLLLAVQLIGARIRSRVFPILQVAFGGATLFCLALLYFRFNAVTLGIVITTLGAMFAMLSAISGVFSHMPGVIPSREVARKRIERDWAHYLSEAKMSEANLSVLSFKTSDALPNYFWEEMRQELRVKDAVMQVKDGQYLLLWNVPSRAATAIARKLQRVIHDKTELSSTVGISSFPLDATNLSGLLTRADTAMKTAEQDSAESIVISIDENRVQPYLETIWHPVLTEAWADEIPVSALIIETEAEISLKDASTIETELRLRDKVFMSKEKIYVLLWDTAMPFMVAQKLQTKLLQKNGRHAAIGMASYPKMAESIGELLTLANTHLEDAKHQTKLQIVPPFSREKSAPFLRQDWFDKLVQARANNVPITVVSLEYVSDKLVTPYALLTKEMRAADSVFALNDGAYILLWNTNKEVARRVMVKLMHILHGKDNEDAYPRLGCSSSEQYGYDLATLIANAEQLKVTAPLSMLSS